MLTVRRTTEKGGGVMARGRGYVALILGVLMALMPFGSASAQSGRSGKTVTIVVGNPGDHWADILGPTYIGRASQNGVYGYRVTLRAADGCEWTHFYPRSMIDFRGDSPGFRTYRVRVATGWLYFPDRLTAKSLPRVYREVQDQEAYYARQADGAIAAAKGFGLVAGMGTLAPGPRVPVPASGAAVRGAGRAGRSAAGAAGRRGAARAAAKAKAKPSSTQTGHTAGHVAAQTVRPSSYALGRALEAAGHVRPPNSAAHHIVAGSAPSATAARAQLSKLGIGINEAANGVFLPTRQHVALHTEAYYRAVNKALESATTKSQAVRILHSIAEGLRAGRFP